MSNTKKPDYTLGAGVFSSSRLDLQYFQILQTLSGHLVDPIIPLETPGLKIADVCCGTGFFLVNIKNHPSTELHALDINLSKLPPEAFLPHIKRHTWNVNDPPPADLISTFDIINCQLLWTFVPDTNIDTVFSNILSLLKPGGYIQWLESSAVDQQIIPADPTYTPQYLTRVYEECFTLYKLPKPTWPSALDNIFSRNGVNVLKPDRTAIEPRNYKSWTMQQMTTWEELRGYFKTTIDGEERMEKVKAFADLVDRCHWEVQVKNCAHIIPFVRVVGRKPTEVNGNVSVDDVA